MTPHYTPIWIHAASALHSNTATQMQQSELHINFSDHLKKTNSQPLAHLTHTRRLPEILEGSKAVPDGHGRHPSMDRYGNDVGSHVGEPLETCLNVLAKKGPHRLGGMRRVCMCVWYVKGEMGGEGRKSPPRKFKILTNDRFYTCSPPPPPPPKKQHHL